MSRGVGERPMIHKGTHLRMAEHGGRHAVDHIAVYVTTVLHFHDLLPFLLSEVVRTVASCSHSRLEKSKYNENPKRYCSILHSYAPIASTMQKCGAVIPQIESSSIDSTAIKGGSNELHRTARDNQRTGCTSSLSSRMLYAPETCSAGSAELAKNAVLV